MTITPYDFQRADLDRLKANNYRALLNIQTGGGKTVQGVFSHIESGSDVTLIIAPDQTHKTAWLPTLEAVGLEGRVIGNTGTKAVKQAMNDFTLGYPGLYLVTPQLFTRSDVAEWSGDLLIVDEAHQLMNPGKTGQRKLGGFSGKDPEALAQRFDGRLALSGTSFRNRFEYAWGHGRLIWPELYRRGEVAYDNYYMWQADRMDYTDVVTGFEWVPVESWMTFAPDTRFKRIDGVKHYGKVKTVKKYLSETDPGRWINEAPCVITHFKRERCCEFHPNGFLKLDAPNVIHETISLAPAQKKAVKDLETHMMTWLDDNPLVTEIPLTKAQRIRQFTLGVPTVTYDEDDNADVSFAEDCVSPFLDRVLAFLEENDEPVTIYTDSQKFAAVATARINKSGIPAFEFSGATRKTRDADLAEFGTKYRVLVGVISAVGTGTDGIQKVSNTEIWLSRSTDETDNEQAEGRQDRLGARRQVQRIILHDDLGLSEGRYGEQIERKLALAKSLRLN